jgi:hypothetical protein
VPEVNDLHADMKMTENLISESLILHISMEKTPYFVHQFVRDEEFTSEYDRAIQSIVQRV